jgi:VacB/RNase II family 3'-5' exoribonuclease
MNPDSGIETIFPRIREELGIAVAFPPEVEAEARAVVEEREWEKAARTDLTAIPFVTIDPPGSRDLDQALHIERAGRGLRARYAIADVGSFVARGGAIEKEAWRRGVTCYSPDVRAPLYPETLSQGAASLLPDEDRPALVFTLDVDAAGELVGCEVERGRVRSRKQLTYEEALAHIEGGGTRFAGEPFADSLMLLRDFGEARLERERARGGVSLPIADQHVQKRAARQLGYELGYEAPNVAEEWNAQLSLLTGHAAARWMLGSRVGLLRTMPPTRDSDVAKLRVAAAALGFDWPASESYADFLHSLDPRSPNLEVLVWQARRLMRGADYTAFDGELPEHTLHSALAMEYAHCTAPLRRLADRYVLDLLMQIRSGTRPSADEVRTLYALPPVMDRAERTAHQLERKVIDVAEAWELRGCIGQTFTALVLDARADRVEAQLVERPVRVTIRPHDTAAPLALGARIGAKLVSVTVSSGTTEFELTPTPA